MNIKSKNGIVTIEGIRDFNTDHIFDCGQCFRWERNLQGGYTGMAYGRPVCISYDEDAKRVTIVNSDEEEAENIWRTYLDLDRDYGKIKRELSGKDPVIANAISYGSGIRILNQEKWETLISFIISQNNNIPRIKGCIDTLARTLGESVGIFFGKEWFKLPSPEVLAEATEEDIAPCKLGYRSKYLLSVGKKVAEEGLDSLDAMALPKLTSDETVSMLQEYDGIGPKVANCIALFAMGKISSFPVDVWVKRVMHELYGLDEKPSVIKSFANEHFGMWGGIAQQYLFYYITHRNKD